MNSKRTKRMIGYVIVLVVAAAIAISTGVVDGVGSLTSMVHISLSAILRVIIMVCFVLLVAGIIQLIMSKLKLKSKRANTVVTIISSLVQYAAAIIIICWGLTILGVSVTTIFASIGLLALIIGFGAESLIEDVITGLFMFFENQYNVGDIIEVSEFRGTVKKIGIRATVLLDSSDNAKIINNSAMRSILNRSAEVSKAVCDISISYEEDLKKVEEILKELSQKIYEQFQDVLLTAPEYLGVQELAESAVVLRIVSTVSEQNIYNATRIMNREYYLALKEHGISLPYQQIDIHSK